MFTEREMMLLNMLINNKIKEFETVVYDYEDNNEYRNSYCSKRICEYKIILKKLEKLLDK